MRRTERSRRGTRWGLLCLALALAGCGDRAARSIEIPDPELTEMEPQVARVLRDARSRVVESPDSAEAWGELGTLYDAHSLFEPAGRCYARARELAPGEFRWAYLLAVVRDLEGVGPDELATLFERARELEPDYAPIPIRLGEAYRRAGRNDEARRELERALELAPASAVALRLLGQVLLAQGDAAAAAERLEAAIAIEPGDLAAHSSLSQAYVRLGREDDARAVVERSHELQPINTLDDPVWDRSVFSKSLSSTRVFRRAMLRLRQGDFAAALADLRIVLEARPEDAGSTHYWIGVALAGDGQSQPAIESFRRALELQPRLNAARIELARLLLAAGQDDAAASHFREALRLSPDDADLHYGLGEAYRHQGRNADAVEEYEAAVRLDATHAARERLAELAAGR